MLCYMINKDTTKWIKLTVVKMKSIPIEYISKAWNFKDG